MVQDHVALDEIELCGELMIAASAADGERLSPDRIDEVLKVAPERCRQHTAAAAAAAAATATATADPGRGAGRRDDTVH
jgi:hypothetical protein